MAHKISKSGMLGKFNLIKGFNNMALTAFVALIVANQSAYAQATGGGGTTGLFGNFTNFFEDLLALLTTGWAVLIASIGVAILGYRWWSGRIEPRHAIAAIGAIVLTVGAPNIVAGVAAAIA